MTADELNMNRETVRLITGWRIGDEKNLCQNVSQESYRAIAAWVIECLCWSAGTSGSRPRVNGPSYHCWRELVFPIWSKDQTPIFGMAFKGVTKTKEITYVPLKSELHACVHLWFCGYCSQRVGSCCTDSQSVLLHKILQRLKRSVMCVRPNMAKDWIPNGDNTPAHTALSVAQFLASQSIMLSRSLLTHLISHRATYFISKSKISSERVPLCVNRRHPEGCNAGLNRRPTCFAPSMLQAMATPLRKVCAGTRDVTWKWPHCRWWINKIKFFEPVSLLYCQAW